MKVINFSRHIRLQTYSCKHNLSALFYIGSKTRRGTTCATEGNDAEFKCCPKVAKIQIFLVHYSLGTATTNTNHILQ